MTRTRARTTWALLSFVAITTTGCGGGSGAGQAATTQTVTVTAPGSAVTQTVTAPPETVTVTTTATASATATATSPLAGTTETPEPTVSPTASATSSPTSEASGSPTSGTASGNEGRIGTTFSVTRESGGGDVEGTGTVQLVSAKTIQPGEFESKAENGRYLAVTIAAQGSSGTFTINPYDFKVIGPDGTEYGQGFITSGGQQLSDRALRSGQRARGEIIFDVPTGPGLELQYVPNLFSDAEPFTWRL